MRQLYVMHGIVPELTRDRQSFRSYITTDEFVYLLGRRARLFGPIDDALYGDGDALTVDDATRASADAARKARELGHDVTLFVNGYQVVSGKPYAFDLLNAMLDGARTETVEHRGNCYDLRRPSGRMLLRKALRPELLRTRTEDERDALVADWAQWLDATPKVSSAAQPLTLADLEELRDAGVRIENHGWTHSDPAALDDDSLMREITEGARWLKSELDIEPRLFAGPYGDFIPSGVEHWPEEVVYLAESSGEKPGWLGDRVYNRASFRDTWKDRAS